MRSLLSLFAFLVLFQSSACAQSPAEVKALLFCQGMGEAVGMIQKEREQGIADTSNQGVKLIQQLGKHAKRDLLTPVETFLVKADPLPPAWTEALYTHACMFNYTEDYAQVEMLSLIIPKQCNIEQPKLRCLQRVYQSLPPASAI